MGNLWTCIDTFFAAANARRWKSREVSARIGMIVVTGHLSTPGFINHIIYWTRQQSGAAPPHSDYS
jgi:hypothetical protein